MNTIDTYDKTANGRTEVTDNATGLSMMDRRVLILMNGEKDVATLAKLSLCDDLGPTIGRLLELGLIEGVETTVVEIKAEDPIEEISATETGDGAPRARDFMCNTLQTFGNRVRITDLNNAIAQASDVEALKVLIKPWYQAISETPGGMYEADALRKEVLVLLQRGDEAA